MWVRVGRHQRRVGILDLASLFMVKPNHQDMENGFRHDSRFPCHDSKIYTEMFFIWACNVLRNESVVQVADGGSQNGISATLSPNRVSLKLKRPSGSVYLSNNLF